MSAPLWYQHLQSCFLRDNNEPLRLLEHTFYKPLSADSHKVCQNQMIRNETTRFGLSEFHDQDRCRGPLKKDPGGGAGFQAELSTRKRIG